MEKSTKSMALRETAKWELMRNEMEEMHYEKGT
jgi:hypothetical protein